MDKFIMTYNKCRTSKGLKCVYKITIGEYFYYGSTNDFLRRSSYYESNFKRHTVLLNKIFRKIAKVHKTGSIHVVFASLNMSVVKMMEHSFLEQNYNNPKSMNRTKSAYNNTGLIKIYD